MPDELARLLAVWRTATAGRTLPAKTDIQLDQIAFCLGNLALAEVARDAFRMRYRLVGQRLMPLFTQREFDLVVKRLGYYRLMLPLSWQVPDRVDILLVAIYPLDPALHRADKWRSLDEVKSYLAAFPEEDFTPDPTGTTV